MTTLLLKKTDSSLGDLARVCSNKTLELHILPTEKCNFRCTYCYETFEKGKMPPKIISGVKNLIKSRANELMQLSISWFGGEPLLASDVVLDISKFAKNTCEESGAIFTGSMTTNAWFLEPKLLTDLVQSNVKFFQITLDGPQTLHDQSRLMANKRGTYEKIWGNLIAAKRSDLDFQIMIRLHIRPSNFDQIYNWLPKLKNEILSDKRFSILVKAIEHLGGPNDDEIDIYKSESVKEYAIDKVYRALSYEKGKNKTDIIAKACYACRPNAWVIRSDGSLARCTVALEDSRNSIGYLSETGELNVDVSKLQPWLKGLETLDPNILGCPIQYI